MFNISPAARGARTHPAAPADQSHLSPHCWLYHDNGGRVRPVHTKQRFLFATTSLTTHSVTVLPQDWPNIPILRGPETGLRQQLLGIFGIWQAVSAAASSGAFRPCFISCITHITKDITIKIYGQQSAKLIILCKTQGRFGDIWFLAIAHCGNVQVLVSRHDMHSHAPLVSLGWQWSKVRLTCRGPGNRIILLQPTHQNWLTLIINVSSDL